MVTAVDWVAFRKCPQCDAETGEPCRSLSGTVRVAGGTLSAFSKPTKAHSSRKPKTGALT